MTTHYWLDFIQSRDLLPISTFYQILRFQSNICDGRGMPTGDAYSSGHMVPSHFGLAYVLLVETNPFPGLVVIFPDYAFRSFLDTISIPWNKAMISLWRVLFKSSWKQGSSSCPLLMSVCTWAGCIVYLNFFRASPLMQFSQKIVYTWNVYILI